MLCLELAAQPVAKTDWTDNVTGAWLTPANELLARLLSAIRLSVARVSGPNTSRI